jgi:hypothetical protein
LAISIPHITTLPNLEQFILGIPISRGNSNPSQRINDLHIKLAVQDNAMTISTPKSTSNIGKVLGTKYTRDGTYYMMLLQWAIPATTPFFDIGIVYTASTWRKKPHLIVKCGSKHVAALADVLSAHFDGQQTSALFLATFLLQTMTFEKHMDYLPHMNTLFPQPDTP